MQVPAAKHAAASVSATRASCSAAQIARASSSNSRQASSWASYSRCGMASTTDCPNRTSMIPSATFCPIGIVEPRDHVKCLDNTREAGTHIPLTARLASHRTRFAPRVIARGRINSRGTSLVVLAICHASKSAQPSRLGEDAAGTNPAPMCSRMPERRLRRHSMASSMSISSWSSRLRSKLR